MIKKKGNVILYVLLVLTLLSLLVSEIRVARLNLTENILSSKTMHNADVATQMMIDDANKSIREEFYSKTYDYKVGDVYLQAEYTPITLKEADSLNMPYKLDFTDLNVKFNTVDTIIESIEVSYPQFETDYLNYFAISDNNELVYNRVNSTYLSKSQITKQLNKNFLADSKPLIYKGDSLNKQYSYDIETTNLKRALYVDIAENDTMYNIKYPLYEQAATKMLSNTKVIISNIKVPINFKELYIVFCNENKPLPTGLFDLSYTYGTDIVTNDVRDNIRRNYSYIRIYKDGEGLVIENSLPIYEEGFQYNTSVQGNTGISIRNMKANLPSNLTDIYTDANKLDITTGSNDVNAQSDSINSVEGVISLATGNRARQIITTDKIPNNILYELKVPTSRQYKINYRIFNSKNILIKKREYILDMR